MPDDLKLRIVADATAVKEGVEEGKTAIKDFASSVSVSFQTVTPAAQRFATGTQAAYRGLSEEVKASADSIDEDSKRIAALTRLNAEARAEVRLADRYARGKPGDATAIAYLAAAQQRAIQTAQALAQAQQEVADKTELAQRRIAAAAAQPAAQAVVQGAAAAPGADDEQRLAVVAATNELNAAKVRQAEVSEAAATAGLDEETTLKAQTAAAADTAAATERLATAKAALKERDDAAAAAARRTADEERANSAVAQQAAAAQSTLSGGQQRYARAAIEKAAADEELRNVTAQLSASTVDQATKEAALAPALNRSRVATLELAAAEEELSESSRRTVTNVQATSGVIRTFDGNGGIRAIERFTSDILGLGGAMQLLFPIVGALGLAGLLFEMGEKAYQAEQKGVHAAENIGRAFSEESGKLEATNDELALTNSRLQDDIDKLNGTPGDGLNTALDEAIVRADRLQQEIAGARKEVEALFNEKNTVGLFSSLLSGAAETGGVQKEISEYAQQVEDSSQKEQLAYKQQLLAAQTAHVQQVAAAKANRDEILASDATFHQAQEAASQAHQARMQKIVSDAQAHMLARARDIQKKQDKADEDQRLMENAGTQAGVYAGAQAVDYSDQRNAFSGAADVFAKVKTNVDLAGVNAQLETLKAAATQKKELAGEGKKTNEAARKAAEDRFKAMEAERVQEQQAGQLGAQADLDYWTMRVNAFARGSEQYAAVQRKIETARQQVTRSGEEFATERTRGAEIEAKNAQATALANVQLDLASGKINKVTADQRTAAIETVGYTDKLLALYAALDDLNNAKDVSPEDKRNKGEALSNQIEETQGQMAASQTAQDARAHEAAQQAKQKDAEAQERLNVALSKGNEIAAQNGAQLRLAQIAGQEARGEIMKLAGLQQVAAVHAQEHIDKLKELQKQLDALKAEGATLRPGTPEADDNAAKQVNVENQMSQENGRAQVQGLQDGAAIQAAQPWMVAFNSIESSWMNVQRAILTGQTSLVNGFKRMASTMALDVVQSFEKMLFASLSYDLRSLAAHHAANAAKAGSDATAAGASDAANQRSALKEIFFDAKSAAAATWKVTAGIPFIGPELAPVAAGAAFAGVMALAAFENGGVVSGQMGVPQVVLAHGGERVLSASQTQNFEKMVGSGPASTGDLHLHLGGNTFNGNDAQKQHGDFDNHVHQSLKRLHKSRKLVFARS